MPTTSAEVVEAVLVVSAEVPNIKAWRYRTEQSIDAKEALIGRIDIMVGVYDMQLVYHPRAQKVIL